MNEVDDNLTIDKQKKLAKVAEALTNNTTRLGERKQNTVKVRNFSNKFHIFTPHGN